jgi:hypothetical protein
MKKYFLLLAFCLLHTANTLPTQNFAADTVEVSPDNDFINDPYVLNIANELGTTRAPITDIAADLIQYGALDILKQNLFLKTNPLNTRNLLDLSTFLPQRYTCAYNNSTELDIFWNQTSAMYLTDKCTGIASYLNILNDKLSAINIKFPVRAGKEISLPDLMPLFKNFTVQERRLGAMVIKEWRHKAVRLSAMMPLYYYERNYYVTADEQAKIEDILGTADEEASENLQKEHLISDKLGFGDCRIYLDFDIHVSKRSVMNFGLLSTLPTALALPQGLLGSHYEAKNRPTFDFEKLYNKIMPPLGGSQQDIKEVKKELMDFALGALDHLSANLLEAKMGNNHFGLGGFVKNEMPLDIFIKRPWAESIRLKSRTSLEYLFPACEQRFFVECNKQEQFEAMGLDGNKETIANKVSADPVYAQTVLNFMDKKMVDLFYPFVRSTRVCPGFVFDWASGVYYEGSRFGFNLGSDLWMKGSLFDWSNKKCYEDGEKFTDVAPLLERPEIKLAYNLALKPFAYQSKLFGTLFAKINRPEKDWIFSLHTDYTLFSSGIGEDFTVTLCLEAKF